MISLLFTILSRSFQFTYCWSLAWRILRITLLACEMSTTVWQSEHSSVLPFFGIGMKTDLFQLWGHFWVFQICWYIECSTLTASSLRILNSSVECTYWQKQNTLPSPIIWLRRQSGHDETRGSLLFLQISRLNGPLSLSLWDILTPDSFTILLFSFFKDFFQCHLDNDSLGPHGL